MSINTIGARIRQKRTELGLLQKELARQVNIDPALMSLIERGYKVPPEPLIPKLAQVLQVSPEWLLRGDDEAEPDEIRTDEFRRDKLAGLIAYLGMTKTSFAETVNISRITLGKYVNGSVPMKYKIVNRICRKYGLRLEYFITDMPIEEAFIRRTPTPRIAPVEEDSSTVAVRLTKRRKQLHLNMAQLARKAGIDPALVSMVERGKRNLTFDKAKKLAPVMGVSVEWLLHGVVEKDPYPLTPDVIHFLENNITLRRWIWEMMEEGIDLGAEPELQN